MTTAKPPTVQGINRLLTQAGFERATTVTSGRHGTHTAGFHVSKHPGGVIVNWWSDTAAVPAYHRTTAQAEQEHRTRRETITRYAEVIEAAGWLVKVTLSLGHLTVHPKNED